MLTLMKYVVLQNPPRRVSYATLVNRIRKAERTSFVAQCTNAGWRRWGGPHGDAQLAQMYSARLAAIALATCDASGGSDVSYTDLVKHAQALVSLRNRMSDAKEQRRLDYVPFRAALRECPRLSAFA